MAHFLAPQPAEPELPVFFNVDGVVGAQPAQNKREDVLLVQFAFQVIASSPLPAAAEMQVAARAVQVTGTVDPATIAAIRALQKSRQKNEPGVVVDGRVSPAKGGYSYGAAMFTIVHLNNLMQNRNINIWPRIDKITGCPSELTQLVQRTLAGT